MKNQGKKDITTEVNINIMVWHTQQFMSSFFSKDDMSVYVDLIFAEANQGLLNSKIPVKLFASGNTKKLSF